MKQFNSFPIGRLILFGLFSLRLMAGAAEFAIQTSVIAGGGQVIRSSDDRFSLAGTIGQAEVSAALVTADGRFTLESGYWHGITRVQMPDSPVLTMRRGFPGTLILAWPKSATGFVLEETADLKRQPWKAVFTRVVDNETEHTVTVAVPIAGMRCYRLKKL